MAMQLILGGAGSGKSYRLYTDVIREAIEHPDRNYIIIVPEQFTMQTQREMTSLHPSGGILNIDILSFQRLAYRVFEETGALRRTILTETGKNLLIRRIALQRQEELTVLKNRLDQPGYISEVKSVLSELTQYEISWQEMDEMIAMAESKPQLKGKLQDIRVLMEGFREALAEKFLTAEEILDVLCQVADQSSLLKKSVLVFDGFTGFTPAQKKTLGVLCDLAPDMRFTVTLDKKETWYGKIQEHELFALSKRTIRTLEELAKEHGVLLEEPVILDGKNGRFADGSLLEWMEQNLFRYGRKERREGETAPQLSVHSARNPMEEVRFAARTIVKLTKEEGLRYREIGIITGDLASYSGYVKQIFEEYEIPCFVDQNIQILQNPCLEFVRGVLGIAQKGYTYENMLRLLRTGFCMLTMEETDLLENYILAAGIRGKKQWTESWTRECRSIAQEDLQLCEQYRSRLMDKLFPYMETLEKKKQSLKDYAGALYEIVRSFEIEQQLQTRSEGYLENGEAVRAKEYEQIYEILIHLLEEAVELLGEEQVSVTEFSQILDAGFSEAKVGMIPPGIDQVQIGDLERSRLHQIRALLFLGVNDGWIPREAGSGGIVSEMEREFLRDKGIELAPTARENGYTQRFYLYLALTKPKERLYLSYCQSDSQGKSMRPSYLIRTMKQMFPDLRIKQEDSSIDALGAVASYRTGMPVLASMLRMLREAAAKDSDPEYLEQLQKQISQLLLVYTKQEEWKEQGWRLIDGAFTTFRKGKLETSIARQLYGEVLTGSVSRVEQFASCAFAHFASYGLGLTERERYQIRMTDIGTVFHDALELYARELQRSEYNWFTIPDEVSSQLADQCVEETMEHRGSGAFFADSRSRHMVERMKRIIRRSVWALGQQVRAGRFVPSSFEVSFSSVQDLQSVNIALSEDEKMRLKGRIDRVDVCEDDKVYVKVVDYKSGAAAFDLVSVYYGLSLQLVVYLNAAMEMEKRLHPDKEVVPAGIFYYHLNDPMISDAKELSPEEINQKILKELIPDGLVNAQEEVIERLDQFMEKESLVIPVARKRTEGFTAASRVATQKQFDQLSEYVDHTVKQLGNQIIQGEISVNPYQRKNGNACRYCIFSDLCGFDRKIPGYQYRKLEELSKQEIWNRMEPKQERQEMFKKEEDI